MFPSTAEGPQDPLRADGRGLYRAKNEAAKDAVCNNPTQAKRRLEWATQFVAVQRAREREMLIFTRKSGVAHSSLLLA
jgi:hypothetical protein